MEVIKCGDLDRRMYDPNERRLAIVQTSTRTSRGDEGDVVSLLEKKYGQTPVNHAWGRAYTSVTDDGRTVPIFDGEDVAKFDLRGLPVYVEHCYPVGTKIPKGRQLDQNSYDVPRKGQIPIGRVEMSDAGVVPGDVWTLLRLDIEDLDPRDSDAMKKQLHGGTLGGLQVCYVHAKQRGALESGIHKLQSQFADGVDEIPIMVCNDGSAVKFLELQMCQVPDISGCGMFLVKAGKPNSWEKFGLQFQKCGETQMAEACVDINQGQQQQQPVATNAIGQQQPANNSSTPSTTQTTTQATTQASSSSSGQIQSAGSQHDQPPKDKADSKAVDAKIDVFQQQQQQPAKIPQQQQPVKIPQQQQPAKNPQQQQSMASEDNAAKAERMIQQHLEHLKSTQQQQQQQQQQKNSEDDGGFGEQQQRQKANGDHWAAMEELRRQLQEQQQKIAKMEEEKAEAVRKEMEQRQEAQVKEYVQHTGASAEDAKFVIQNMQRDAVDKLFASLRQMQASQQQAQQQQQQAVAQPKRQQQQNSSIAEQQQQQPTKYNPMNKMWQMQQQQQKQQPPVQRPSAQDAMRERATMEFEDGVDPQRIDPLTKNLVETSPKHPGQLFSDPAFVNAFNGFLQNSGR